MKHKILRRKIKSKRTKKSVHRHNKKIMVASIVVVGTGLVLGLVFAPAFRHTGPALPHPPDLKPFTPPPVYFVEGASLPEGFPAGLILEKDIKVSVAIVTPQGTSTMQILATSTRVMMGQQTVRWSSSMSFDALTSAYESYFSKNGWTVVSTNNSPDGKFRTIHATKDVASVTVSLSSRPDETLVTVGYKAR
jgi:hypothetical protein